MNRVYKSIWNAKSGTYVAAAEATRAGGKSGSSRALATATLLLALAPSMAFAAPTAGVVTSGSGAITQQGATTTINQGSATLSLNWASFNIGAHETVQFIQPSASSIAVNRIFDTAGSQILGRLNANGQVYLINPNGILFGQGAQVNVGGLVASTLDSLQLHGSSVSLSGAGQGSVVNQGQIEGRYVALVGNTVANDGTINTPNGTAALGAGSAVTLSFAGSDLVGLQVDTGVLNALARNGGLMQADGGRVLLSAGAKDDLLASVVNNTGIVRARTVDQRGGEIVLLGGMAAGTVQVGGTLDASAPAGGTGGAIDTSAAHVKVTSDAQVTTLSSTGQNGSWLIDPTDFTIGSGGSISGATLSASLGSGNVTILSSAGAGSSGAGNIYVNDTVSWGANLLTLTAAKDIVVNAVMTGTGSASLALNPATANGSDAAVAGGAVKMGLGTAGSVNAGTGNAFTGQVNFNSAGTLSISGNTYTVINSLGSAGSTTGTDLQGIHGNLSGRYVLGSNIDATATAGWNAGAGFNPIGLGSGSFTGAFNGLGHSIDGLTISRAGNTEVGLFSRLNGASVRNVGLSAATVAGAGNIGQLVGYATNSTINRAYASGTVTSGGGLGSVGGLIGALAGTTVSESFTAGSLTSTGGGNVGGMLGAMEGGGLIDNSYSAMTVNSTNVVGGLVGAMSSANTSTDSTVSNSYATGNVTGSLDTVGGLVGYMGGTVSKSYATGNVTAPGGRIGGLVGHNGADISGSYATGAVTSANGGELGGLIGRNDIGATVDSSYATGNVSSQGNYQGGLAGRNLRTITNSYATGNVGDGGTGNADYVGGLVGQTDGNRGPLITNSYATGAVTGGSYVGAVLGRLDTGLVNNTFYLSGVNGAVTGLGSAGSLRTGGSSNAGIADVAGITHGMSLAALRAKLNLTSATGANGNVNPGWDFDTTPIWGYEAGRNNDMPVPCAFITCVLTIRVYVAPVTGSNVYGSAPLFSYSLVDASGSPYSLTNASVTGTALYVGSPILPSSSTGAGSYSFSYDSGLSLSGSGASQYVLSAYSLPTAWTVTRAPLTVTALGASRAYNASSYSGGNGISYSGFVNGETAAVLGGALGYAGSAQGARNVGSYSVTPQGLSSSNYAISYTSGTLAITPAALTLAAASASKTYDGTLASSGAVTVTGLQGSDSISGISQAYNSKDVASATTLTVNSGYTVNDGNGGGNYTVSTTGAAGSITAAALSVTAQNASQAYNASTYGGGNGVAYSGFVNGETAAVLGGTLGYGGSAQGARNVGSYALTPQGLSSSNYAISYTSGTLAITPAALTLAATSASKTYDGTLASSGAVTVTGLQGSDSISGISQAYNSKDVAGASTLSVNSGYTVNDGNGGGNYTVSTAGAAGSITPATLTVTALNASPSYNASSYSGGNGVSYSGFVNGESAAVLGGTLGYGGSAQGARNVGSYSLTPQGLSSSNYAISYTSGTLAITPAALTLAAASAGKTYDGTLASSGAVTVTGLQGSDSVSGASQSYNSKDVVGASTLTVNSGYTVNDGNGGGNYTVSTAGAAGSITPATLTVTALNASPSYNASSYSGGNGVSYSGFVNGESAAVLGGALGYGGSAQGARNVGSYSLTPQGLSSSNYAISYTSGTLAITPAALTLAASSASKTYDGTLTSSGAVTVTGLQGSDSISGISQVYNSKDVASATTLTVNSGYTVNDGNGGRNYTVSTSTATASIAPAVLSYVAAPASMIAGTSTPSLSGTVTGFVGGDTLANATTGSLVWSSSAGQTGAPAAYAVQGGGLAAANYVFTQAAGNATALVVQPGVLPSPVVNAVAVYTTTQSSTAMPPGANPGSLLPPTASGAGSGGASAGNPAAAAGGTIVSAPLALNGLSTLQISDGGVNVNQFKRPAPGDAGK
ncbi:MBG domain-containing protein [Pelomonas parva]|uniref:MBG domain-containing protein n=1 Tax=Pelomonas parva TaxID=3299032 RepID=A0ABW7F0S5_9BURK